MQTYEKYKDSGVEWIGKVPEHWEIRRLKTDTFLKGRIGWNGLRSDEFKESSYAYLVTGQDFTGPNINWDKCYQIDKVRYDEDPFIQLQNGDILITKDGTIGKISKVSRMDKPACLNSGIFVMKQRSSHLYEQGYIYWLLTSNLLSEYNQYTSTGTTILHLYQNVFENMPLLIPTLLEQQAIVSYLDKKCADIDKVIATQQRRIELLQELKQSTITHAVTRGLNPNVKMKDSGVEWIGEVPEHWNTLRLRFVCELRNGYTPSKANPDFWSEGTIPWYRMEDIRESGRRLNEAKQYITESAIKGGGLFEAGSFIMATTATIGEHAVLIVDSLANQRFTNLKIRKSLSHSDFNAFFFQYLFVVDDYCKTTTKTATFPAVNMEDLKNFIVCIPPLDEQKIILTYLDKRCAELDNSISKAQKEIDLLQEYKQALISEVVTGKRKVC